MMRRVIVLLALAALTGCRTVAPLPPADLATPGWQTRTGQAVWQPRRTAPEITGELLVATRDDGSAFVQFTKNPFPFVIARTTANSWQVEFPTMNRFYSGRGTSPTRLIWLHLPRLLREGQQPREPFMFERLDAARWRVVNRKTGESLEAVLNP